MFKHVDYVMVAVSDMEKSVQFYRDKLGLRLRFQSKEWTEFDTGSTTLALHGGGTPRSEPESRDELVAGTCSIGFQINDLEKTYQELKAKGVEFAMPPTKREEERIKLAMCVDPDGLQISLAESVQETK